MIHTSKSHKFLGIVVDEDLNVKAQAAQALAKGTKYAMACNRMIRPTKGIHGRLMKRLHEDVIIPKMLYAADVWCAGLVAQGRGKRRQRLRIPNGQSTANGNVIDHRRTKIYRFRHARCAR